MDVHQRLKDKTKAYHQQIERASLINQLMSDSINIANYQLLLKKFHAYIQPCEKAICASSWSSLLDAREKTSRLTNDLLDLGTSTKRKCQALPPLNSKEDILGYLYVLEGATLGGQIIAKRLHDRLGLTAQHGARYFNAYGPDTMKMWLAFCHLLNQANTLQEQHIMAAAARTYTTLIDCLNQEWTSHDH